MEKNESGYHIQGVQLSEIVEQFGSPTYVYDAAKIEEKVNILKSAFSAIPMKIKYAAKANTNISLLGWMKKLGVEIDVVSPQEMQIALKAGFSPEQIAFTSSGVGFHEIEECVSNGILTNIDNLHSLELFGMKYGNTVPVMVRIRPNILAGGNLKISTGHKDSKFGIPVEQVDQIHALRQKYDIQIIGVHQHTGSDIKDVHAYTEAAKIIFDLALGFPNLKIIDLGGGFKVAYSKNDHIIDIQDLAAELVPAFQAFCTQYGTNLELWFEPGKFLVSECGVLLAEVNVRKDNPNSILLGLNTGLNHLIRPMMYDAHHDVVNVSSISEEKEVYNVVGYICETDNIALGRKLNKSKAGDIIAIKNAGAYGFAMSSQYNSRFRPAEVMIHKGVSHLVRKRETLEDVLKNQELVHFN
ncbi:MAG: diaminopimelate decarboxylase [Leadbetterella sp.]